MANGRYVKIGEEVITGLSSVKYLTLVSGSIVSHVMLTPLSKSVRYRFNASPDASTGHLIAADETIILTQDLDNVRFLETAASASLMVTYFGGPINGFES